MPGWDPIRQPNGPGIVLTLSLRGPKAANGYQWSGRENLQVKDGFRICPTRALTRGEFELYYDI